MIFGIILFAALLVLSIMIHEGAHLIFAKKFGMKATEYFCGFGPKIFSFKKGETEYGLKAIPAGGYVKILGMSPNEELDPEDAPRAFYRQSTYKRFLVIFAGSASHLLTAFILLWVALSVLGTAQISNTIGEVRPCLEESCTDSSPVSPAQAAGLEPGDKIISIDGVTIENWSTDSAEALESIEGNTLVVVEREGALETFNVDVASGEEGRGQLGVMLTYESLRQSPLEGASLSGQQVKQFVTGSFQGLAALPSGIARTVEATFGDKERTLEDPIGVVGIARISGEISEADTIPLAARVSTIFILVAGANVFFGVFNLLPLPPLDGGHLATMFIESVKKKIAKLRKRSDPGPFAPESLAPLTITVVAVFLSLTLILLVADIVEPITLFKS